MNNSLSIFRKIAFWEGLSAILLFFVAMPMKYLGDIKMAVTVVGGIHGFLWTVFLVAMVIVGQKYKWSTGVYVVCIVASIIPFGTFVLESRFLKPLSLK